MVRQQKPIRPKGSAWLLTLLCGALGAQTQFDADRRERTPTPLFPNGTHTPVIATQSRQALVIRSDTTWAPGRYLIEARGGGRCDLIVEAGANLRATDALIEVRGDIFFKAGSFVRIDECEFVNLNSRSREFSFYWEGGHLETHRSVVGGVQDASGVSQPSNMHLNNGLWTAYDTVYSHTGGVLVGLLSDDGRGNTTGFRGQPELTGGELVADGLYAGTNSDAVHVSGWGDVKMSNSTTPISLYLYEAGGSSSRLNLDTENRVVHDVYGDPALHDSTFRTPINRPIPSVPWRLELENHLVPNWRLRFFDVVNSNGSNDRRYVLENASLVTVGFTCVGLTQSPTLVGPWATFFPPPRTLPALPTFGPPGEHRVPPGCGIKFGNVIIEAPTRAAPGTVQSLDDWVGVNAWAIVLRSGSDVSIRGNMTVAEAILLDSKLELRGGRAFDARMFATSFSVLQGRGVSGFPASADLMLREVRIGKEFLQPQIDALGSGTALVERSISSRLVLTTDQQPFGPLPRPDSARILTNDLWETPPLTRANQLSPGGQITINRPNTAQTGNFLNADFEGGVRAGGAPDHWSLTRATGASSSTRRALSPGSRSFQLNATGSSGWVEKTIPLPVGTVCGFRGWLRANAIPAGAALRAEIRGSGSVQRSAPITPPGGGAWSMIDSGPYEVRPADTSVTFRLSYSGAPSNGGGLSVLLDDFVPEILDWWENDNLLNADFEMASRNPFGVSAPLTSKVWAPPYWANFGGVALDEAVETRPGAAAGSQGVRIKIVDDEVLLHKDLTWLEPGQQLRFSGWLKGVPGAASGSGIVQVKVHMGAGSNWGNLNYGNNQFWFHNFTGASGWQQFSLVYTVPPLPIHQAFTRVAITTGGTAAGDSVLVDDFTLTVN